MSTLSCRFCAHRNPPGAKFCSDCGSPLALKPCPKCEAITDVDAELCRQCGAPFDAAVATDAAAEAPGSIQQTVDVEDRAGAIAVPRESAHVPESLADRLGGSATARRNDEKVEPQVPLSLDGSSDVTEADDDPPGALRSRAFAPAPKPFRWVTAAVAVIAIGVAGYYIYAGRIPDVPRHGEVALAGKNTPAPAPTLGSSPASTTQQLESTKSSAEPAISPAGPVAPPTKPVKSPAEPVQSQPEAVQPQSESMRPRPTVKSQKEPAVRTRKPHDPATLATKRLIARDPGADADAPDRPSAPLDKDAIATQRLIERELGPFLPDKANAASRDALPAVDGHSLP